MTLYGEGSNASSTNKVSDRPPRGAMLALPIRSSGSEGSGMFIGDPLGEGSKC